MAANLAGISGVAHAGIDSIPREGTYLLDGGERVIKPEQNKDLTKYLANSSSGSSAKVSITVIEAPGGDQLAVEQRQNGDTLEVRVRALVRKVVGEDVGAGRGVASTLQNTYGLRRQGVA